MLKPEIFLLNKPIVANGLEAESTTPTAPLIGDGNVLNTTPLSVMVEFPLLVIIPDKVALFVVILDLEPVITVGATGGKTSILSTAQPSSVPKKVNVVLSKRILTFTFD